jgi:sugar lactone lactonase YvrE
MRPEFFPVLRTLISDDAGRLWVEATAPEGNAWAVIDSTGRLLGEATIPERDGTVRPYARGNLLYLVMKDEDDLQAVHIYEAQLAAGRQ